MSIKEPSEQFIKLAKTMNPDAAERIMSRMTGKLPKRLVKEKLTRLEAIAIQLELEDELLQDWRKNFAEIQKKMSKPSKSRA